MQPNNKKSYIMYHPETSITTTAKNYNIQEREVIFAHLVAAGITRGDAYYYLFARNTKSKTTTSSQADTEAAELVKDKPGIKILIQKLKNRSTVNTPYTQDEVRNTIREIENEEDEENDEGRGSKELATRQGLTKRLRTEISGIHGKDSVQGLIQLAKLEGYDKEEREEEEKRRYFLPWRSKCRACALMKAYQAAQEPVDTGI